MISQANLVEEVEEPLFSNGFHRMLNAILSLVSIRAFNHILPGRPQTQESVNEWELAYLS